MKRKILLRRIILNFCTPSQLRKFDELCNTNIGSACHFALRLIEAYFDRKYTPDAPVKSPNMPLKPENALKINQGDTTWFVEK